MVEESRLDNTVVVAIILFSTFVPEFVFVTQLWCGSKEIQTFVFLWKVIQTVLVALIIFSFARYHYANYHFQQREIGEVNIYDPPPSYLEVVRTVNDS